MKLSIFNTRIPLSENTDVIFNTFSEEMLVINRNVKLNIPYIDTSFIKVLKEKGFLVDDQEDEYTKVVTMFKKSYNRDSVFKLTINPTLKCNFRCWYCYETHNNSSTMTNQTLNRVKKSIRNLSEKYNSLELSFFGGEPFLKFSEIVKPLIDYTHIIYTSKGLDYQVTFTTNGYLINSHIIETLKKYNIGISQITLDGGPETHNKTRVSAIGDSFAQIVANIKSMATCGLPVLIRINVTKDNIQSAYKIPDYFRDLSDIEKKQLHILIQQVWQDVHNDILDEIWEVYTKFLEIGIKPWPRKFNFYQTICYADHRHSAVINYDGKIHKCTAIDFETKTPDGTLDEYGLFDIDYAFQRRIKQRLDNHLCLSCRILPVCNGGCSKNVDQASIRDYCLHPTNEDKDNVVKNIIREKLYMRRLNIS